MDKIEDTLNLNSQHETESKEQVYKINGNTIKVKRTFSEKGSTILQNVVIRFMDLMERENKI